KFFEQLPDRRQAPFFAAVVPTFEAPSASQPDLVRALAQVPRDERRALLAAHVRSLVAKVLGLTSAESIKSRQRLFDLGLDSLMAVELKNHLEYSLGRTLRSTLVFDYPTMEGLLDYLSKDVLLAQFASESVAASPPAMVEQEHLATTLSELAEDDIA